MIIQYKIKRRINKNSIRTLASERTLRKERTKSTRSMTVHVHCTHAHTCTHSLGAQQNRQILPQHIQAHVKVSKLNILIHFVKTERLLRYLFICIALKKR